MRKLSIFLGFLLLIPCFLYLLFSLQINTKSNIPGYNLKVDRIRFARFLFENGYYSGEGIWKSARITLTNESQPFMAVTKDKNVSPFQSVTIKKDQKGTTIIAHYDSDILEEILSYGDDGQRRINLDVLAYVCVAQSETKTGLFDKDVCYQKAENYLENNSGLIFRLEKRTSKIGFHLVKTAYAAGCTGLVECEPGVTTCTCSVGGASCTNSATSCGPGGTGTCNCTFSCTGSGGGAMDYYYCSSNTTRASCLSAGGAEALCENKGMCAVGGGCFWINDDGTIATPSPGGGGGGCTCNCMSATSPSCDDSRVGLWNIAFKTGGGNTTPVGESYIATVPNYLPSGLNICADAGSCLCSSGWKMISYGYIHIPVTGKYIFRYQQKGTSDAMSLGIDTKGGDCHQKTTFTLSSGVLKMTVNDSVFNTHCTPLTATAGTTYPYYSYSDSGGNPANLTTVATTTDSYCDGNSSSNDSEGDYFYEVPDGETCGGSWTPGNSANAWDYYWLEEGWYPIRFTKTAPQNLGGGQFLYYYFGDTPAADALWGGPTLGSNYRMYWDHYYGEPFATKRPIDFSTSTFPCTEGAPVVTPTSAWWQVKDGDVSANGNLRSEVPSATSLYFNIVGSGGFPGVPAYTGSTNLTASNVSTKRWISNPSTLSAKNYTSSYFASAVPKGVQINTISGTNSISSTLTTGGSADSNGYYWYVYDGNSTHLGDLSISSSINIGTRKVILIVKNAGLNIKGNISLTKGRGFFMAVSSGNMDVSSTVTSVEGIYVTDGYFSTGTGGSQTDSQLHVRGTVVGYNGITLERDLGNSANATTPGELFEYAPDQELLFPADFSKTITIWREIAP